MLLFQTKPGTQHESAGRCAQGSFQAGRTMVDQPALTQEARIDLQIQMDRLRRAGDRCRQGLNDLARGSLTPAAYLNLRQEFETAQRVLEQRHTKYFASYKRA